MQKQSYITVGLGVVVVALLFVLSLVWPRGVQQELVIVDEQPYTLISFGEARVPLGKEKIPSYVLTIAYKDPAKKGSRRGTIAVPQRNLVRDYFLPVNTVVWEKPTQLEGQTYKRVRWNPGHSVEARDDLEILPEDKPITRDVQ